MYFFKVISPCVTNVVGGNGGYFTIFSSGYCRRVYGAVKKREIPKRTLINFQFSSGSLIFSQKWRIKVSYEFRRLICSLITFVPLVCAVRAQGQRPGEGQVAKPDSPQVQADIEKAKALAGTTRSEERRVGKECRSRWSPYP